MLNKIGILNLQGCKNSINELKVKKNKDLLVKIHKEQNKELTGGYKNKYLKYKQKYITLKKSFK